MKIRFENLACWTVICSLMLLASCSQEPQTSAPPDELAWDRTLTLFRNDLQAMGDLVMAPSTDLFARIPHGDGQTILREALLVADHNAYHLGQLVAVRQALGAW